LAANRVEIEMERALDKERRREEKRRERKLIENASPFPLEKREQTKTKT
jgi:hypothetical protein